MRGREGKRGAALLLALIVTAIISALLSGILLLGVSHLSLSNLDSDYANALNLAEAGINYEVWKLSQDANTADVEWTPWTHLATSADAPSDTPRWYRVRVESVEPGVPWSPPSTCWVVAQGNVGGQVSEDGSSVTGGVTRTVRIQAEGKGIFGLYALFGVDELHSRGSLVVNGAVGADGLVDVTGNVQYTSNFWYCGSGSGGSEAFLNQGPPTGTKDPVGGIVYDSDLTEVFPTVNDMAVAQAGESPWNTTDPNPPTINFFKTHNSNNLARTTSGAPVTIRNFTLDNNTFRDIADGTIVFPPGDYYFESINLPSNNSIKIDSSLGPVNFWIGPEAGRGGDDTINGQMLFTSQDASRFHVYDGSDRVLRLNGTMDFYGSVLAYNTTNGRSYGSVKINGDGVIWGSVIAYDVERSSGNATITFPSTGGGSAGAGEPIIYVGIEQTWEEVNPL